MYRHCQTRYVYKIMIVNDLISGNIKLLIQLKSISRSLYRQEIQKGSHEDDDDDLDQVP